MHPHLGPHTCPFHEKAGKAEDASLAALPCVYADAITYEEDEEPESDESDGRTRRTTKSRRESREESRSTVQ